MTVIPSPAPAVGESAPRRFLRQIAKGERANLVRFASVVTTLGVWEWYGRGVDPVFLSYPTAIVGAVPKMIERGELQAAIASSVEEAIYLGDRVIVMSSRPGRISADIMTELPRPRADLDVKSSARFDELRHIVRNALRHDRAVAA